MSGPCLCGDPECGRCFPGAYYERRAEARRERDEARADEDENVYGSRTIRVYAECCREWINEGDVHMTNIEEDAQGADVVTFDCPRCGHSHKSRRVG
jgi:hypothetical protein